MVAAKLSILFLIGLCDTVEYMAYIQAVREKQFLPHLRLLADPNGKDGHILYE